MFTMKRRNILLVVVGIGALVMTVCCVLWCCNTRTADSLAELTQQETQRGDFDLSFNYNLGSPSPLLNFSKRTFTIPTPAYPVRLPPACVSIRVTVSFLLRLSLRTKQICLTNCAWYPACNKIN